MLPLRDRQKAYITERERERERQREGREGRENININNDNDKMIKSRQKIVIQFTCPQMVLN